MLLALAGLLLAIAVYLLYSQNKELDRHVKASQAEWAQYKDQSASRSAALLTSCVEELEALPSELAECFPYWSSLKPCDREEYSRYIQGLLVLTDSLSKDPLYSADLLTRLAEAKRRLVPFASNIETLAGVRVDRFFS